MGFNFRKSFKIAPGVRLNVGKKGISSVSVGGKGARVSVGKKGTRTTISAPGTGLSYSSYKPHKSKVQKQTTQNNLMSSTNSSEPDWVVMGIVGIFSSIILALTIEEDPTNKRKFIVIYFKC